jgi:hypothetical protein
MDDGSIGVLIRGEKYQEVLRIIVAPSDDSIVWTGLTGYEPTTVNPRHQVAPSRWCGGNAIRDKAMDRAAI